jgi:hypothetical protein
MTKLTRWNIDTEFAALILPNLAEVLLEQIHTPGASP